MREQSLQPDVNHHNVMVDTFGRANRLQEAEDNLKAHARTSIVGHTALLAACRTHGDADRAERIHKDMAKLPGFTA